MNLIIMDQTYKFANEPESVPALLSTVEDILIKNNMILSHLVIDGLEAHELRELLIKYCYLKY